jgi:hypothetical protein
MPPAVVVTAVMAPAHMRSIARPGTDVGRPAINDAGFAAAAPGHS